MVEARVRWFDQIHGLGMATVPGEGQVRVHYRALRPGAYRALDAGDTIRCRLERTPGGLVARDVELVAQLPRE